MSHHVLDLQKAFFCTKCGHPASAKVACKNCGFILYQDPKVAAGTIFCHDNRVVLLQRAIEPSYGKWVFPGGFVDRGEKVESAAIRETKEETGVDVQITELLNVYSYPGYPVVVIVYMAEILSGTPRACDESLDVDFFSPSQIPWKKLAFDSTEEALKDYLNRINLKEI